MAYIKKTQHNLLRFFIYFFLSIFFIFASAKLLRGVIGNTSDSGSEKFRFEP